MGGPRLFRAVFWAGLLAAAVVLIPSCSPREQGAQPTGNPPTVLEGQPRQETTSGGGTARTLGHDSKPSGAEATEPPFTTAPEMNGGSKGAADSIREIRFAEHEGYERAVIGFGSEDALASRVPAWSLSSPTGEGYARITFADVASTSVPDKALGGSIMDNLYAVRAPGGGMFVDIFATGAFQYRVVELSDPGRLVIDYRPAGVDLSLPIPAQAKNVVLFQPRKGEAITSPLKVSGYSRNFEASNTILLRGPSGNVLSESTVLSNDWAETWGYFEASLEFPAFAGRATLQVGEGSPNDGSFQGVEIPVIYGAG